MNTVIITNAVLPLANYTVAGAGATKLADGVCVYMNICSGLHTLVHTYTLQLPAR